jgi:hypothetical protein
MSSILDKVKFAEIEPTAQKGKPAGSVRTNGTMVFNDLAQAVVGVSPEKNYFKVGNDDEGRIYLVPAKAGETNTLKAVKAGNSFMFKQVNELVKLGATEKRRYAVSAEKDGEGEDAIEFYVLTPNKDLPEVEKTASEGVDANTATE